MKGRQKLQLAIAGVFVLNILILLLLARQLHVVNSIYDAFSFRTKNVLGLDENSKDGGKLFPSPGGLRTTLLMTDQEKILSSPSSSSSSSWSSTSSSFEATFTEEEISENLWLVTNPNGVYIRESSSLSSQIIGTLPLGSLITVRAPLQQQKQEQNQFVIVPSLIEESSFSGDGQNKATTGEQSPPFDLGVMRMYSTFPTPGWVTYGYQRQTVPSGQRDQEQNGVDTYILEDRNFLLMHIPGSSSDEKQAKQQHQQKKKMMMMEQEEEEQRKGPLVSSARHPCDDLTTHQHNIDFRGGDLKFMPLVAHSPAQCCKYCVAMRNGGDGDSTATADAAAADASTSGSASNVCEHWTFTGIDGHLGQCWLKGKEGVSLIAMPSSTVGSAAAARTTPPSFTSGKLADLSLSCEAGDQFDSYSEEASIDHLSSVEILKRAAVNAYRTNAEANQATSSELSNVEAQQQYEYNYFAALSGASNICRLPLSSSSSSSLSLVGKSQEKENSGTVLAAAAAAMAKSVDIANIHAISTHSSSPLVSIMSLGSTKKTSCSSSSASDGGGTSTGGGGGGGGAAAISRPYSCAKGWMQATSTTNAETDAATGARPRATAVAEWTSQYPIGNGRFGALVGGTLESEVVPVSTAGFYARKLHPVGPATANSGAGGAGGGGGGGPAADDEFSPQRNIAKKSSSSNNNKEGEQQDLLMMASRSDIFAQAGQHGAAFKKVRERFTSGKVNEAQQEVNSLIKGEFFGSFQYLADLSILFSASAVSLQLSSSKIESSSSSSSISSSSSSDGSSGGGLRGVLDFVKRGAPLTARPPPAAAAAASAASAARPQEYGVGRSGLINRLKSHFLQDENESSRDSSGSSDGHHFGPLLVADGILDMTHGIVTSTFLEEAPPLQTVSPAAGDSGWGSKQESKPSLRFHSRKWFASSLDDVIVGSFSCSTYTQQAPAPGRPANPDNNKSNNYSNINDNKDRNLNSINMRNGSRNGGQLKAVRRNRDSGTGSSTTDHADGCLNAALMLSRSATTDDNTNAAAEKNTPATHIDIRPLEMKVNSNNEVGSNSFSFSSSSDLDGAERFSITSEHLKLWQKQEQKQKQERTNQQGANDDQKEESSPALKTQAAYEFSVIFEPNIQAMVDVPRTALYGVALCISSTTFTADSAPSATTAAGSDGKNNYGSSNNQKQASTGGGSKYGAPIVCANAEELHLVMSVYSFAAEHLAAAPSSFSSSFSSSSEKGTSSSSSSSSSSDSNNILHSTSTYAALKEAKHSVWAAVEMGPIQLERRHSMTFAETMSSTALQFGSSSSSSPPLLSSSSSSSSLTSPSFSTTRSGGGRSTSTSTATATFTASTDTIRTADSGKDGTESSAVENGANVIKSTRLESFDQGCVFERSNATSSSSASSSSSSSSPPAAAASAVGVHPIADDQLLATLFQYGRYLLHSSAGDGGAMSNLQGLWADGPTSAWSGDYHLNINMQMMYWAADAVGLSSARKYNKNNYKYNNNDDNNDNINSSPEAIDTKRSKNRSRVRRRRRSRSGTASGVREFVKRLSISGQHTARHMYGCDDDDYYAKGSNGDTHTAGTDASPMVPVFTRGSSGSTDPDNEFQALLLDESPYILDNIGLETVNYVAKLPQLNTRNNEKASFSAALRPAGAAPWTAHGFTDGAMQTGLQGDIQWAMCVTCGVWSALHTFEHALHIPVVSVSSSSTSTSTSGGDMSGDYKKAEKEEDEEEWEEDGTEEELISELFTTVLPSLRGASKFFVKYLWVMPPTGSTTTTTTGATGSSSSSSKSSSNSSVFATGSVHTGPTTSPENSYKWQCIITSEATDADTSSSTGVAATSPKSAEVEKTKSVAAAARAAAVSVNNFHSVNYLAMSPAIDVSLLRQLVNAYTLSAQWAVDALISPPFHNNDTGISAFIERLLQRDERAAIRRGEDLELFQQTKKKAEQRKERKEGGKSNNDKNDSSYRTNRARAMEKALMIVLNYDLKLAQQLGALVRAMPGGALPVISASTGRVREYPDPLPTLLPPVVPIATETLAISAAAGAVVAKGAPNLGKISAQENAVHNNLMQSINTRVNPPQPLHPKRPPPVTPKNKTPPPPPPFPTQTEHKFNGSSCVLFEANEDLDPGHRHYSLMHWLYPNTFQPYHLHQLPSSNGTATADSAGNSVSPETDYSDMAVKKALLADAAALTMYTKSLNGGGHTGWSACWEATLYARLRQPALALKSLSRIVTRFMTLNMLGLHPPLSPNNKEPKQCNTCFSENDQFAYKVKHKQQEQLQLLLALLKKPSLPTPAASAGAKSMPSSPVLHRNKNNKRNNNNNKVPAVIEEIRTFSRNAATKKAAGTASLNIPRGMITQDDAKFQLDTNLGLVAAVVELLVQSHNPGEIELLPALPSTEEISESGAGASSTVAGLSAAGALHGVVLRGDVTASFAWDRASLTASAAASAAATPSTITGVVLLVSSAHPWLQGVCEDKLYPGFFSSSYCTNNTSSSSSSSSSTESNRAMSPKSESRVRIVSPNPLLLLSSSSTANRDNSDNSRVQECALQIRPPTSFLVYVPHGTSATAGKGTSTSTSTGTGETEERQQRQQRENVGAREVDGSRRSKELYSLEIQIRNHPCEVKLCAAVSGASSSTSSSSGHGNNDAIITNQCAENTMQVMQTLLPRNRQKSSSPAS